MTEEELLKRIQKNSQIEQKKLRAKEAKHLKRKRDCLLACTNYRWSTSRHLYFSIRYVPWRFSLFIIGAIGCSFVIKTALFSTAFVYRALPALFISIFVIANLCIGDDGPGNDFSDEGIYKEIQRINKKIDFLAMEETSSEGEIL